MKKPRSARRRDGARVTHPTRRGGRRARKGRVSDFMLGEIESGLYHDEGEKCDGHGVPGVFDCPDSPPCYLIRLLIEEVRESRKGSRPATRSGGKGRKR